MKKFLIPITLTNKNTAGLSGGIFNTAAIELIHF